MQCIFKTSLFRPVNFFFRNIFFLKMSHYIEFPAILFWIGVSLSHRSPPSDITTLKKKKSQKLSGLYHFDKNVHDISFGWKLEKHVFPWKAFFIVKFLYFLHLRPVSVSFIYHNNDLDLLRKNLPFVYIQSSSLWLCWQMEPKVHFTASEKKERVEREQCQ